MTVDRVPKVRGPTSLQDRFLFDWVGDSDGATNGDVYKPKLKLRDDYPIEYSCEDALEGQDASISEVWFRYDYDLTLDGVNDPAETRRAFEWSVLWNVGVELGLYNCSMDMQQSPMNGRHLLMQEERLLGATVNDAATTDDVVVPSVVPSQTRVIALGNDQEDQMNTQAREYFIYILSLKEVHTVLRFCVAHLLLLSFFTSTETCFTNDDGCRPMKGIMNALYTGDERDVENMVLHLIQKVMATDAVQVKGVSRVQYIGDRETYQVPPSTISSSGTSGTSRSPMRSFGLAIGVSVGASVLIGLIVGMLVARVVRKRGGKDSDTGMSVTSIEILNLDDGNKGDMEEFKDEITPSVAEEGNANTDVEIQEVQQETSVITAPPQQSQSLPSKRRRRRKKKKKKKIRMGLTRSNSVTSMDTITEENEDEEDSDNGSDFGSEYSTDDEDQEFGLRKTMSTGSLTSDPSLASLSFPLGQVKESPRIKRLPPPPV